MANLDARQLTGRSRDHVIEVAELGSVLHPRAAQAFLALRREAAAAGLDVAVASGFRDFERQLAIWNDKFRGRRTLLDPAGQPLDASVMSEPELIRAILHWSALPGASRHHWGTEIDVIDRAALQPGQRPGLVPAEYAPGGVFQRLEGWLSDHAGHFGFFRPYDRDRGGVQPEPWHLSYAPVAAAAQRALTVDVLEQALADVDLGGGAAVRAQLADIHARYVCLVAPPSKLALAAPGIGRERISPAARPS